MPWNSPVDLFSTDTDLAAVASAEPPSSHSPCRSVVDWATIALHFVQTAGAAGAAFDAPELLPEITVTDCERARRFRRREDARNHLAGRWLARRALGALLECAPADVPIVISDDGRPELLGNFGPRFSISHTDGIALCAVACDGTVDVGVDVEAIDRAEDVEDVAEMFVSNAEGRAIAALAPAARLRALLALWTLKEAYGKAMGYGVANALTGVDFRSGADGRPQLVAPDAPCWHFSLATLHDRWFVALATRKDA